MGGGGVNVRLTSFPREVVAQLQVMFNHMEEEAEPDRIQGHRGDMSILDKMSMWISKTGQDYPIHHNADLFEGVKGDEEDPIDQIELSTYHKIILDSPAYEWFLSNVVKESIIKLETSQPRIRQRILDELPTGIISKRRNPKVYAVTFDVEWQHTMEERLRHELSEESKYPKQFFREFIVMTGSRCEAQGLTIKEYLTQTWPMTGLKLFDALRKAATSFAQHSFGESETALDCLNCANSHIVTLPGNTQLEIRICSSHLILTATGPAYFVGDCGESLAWIGSALLSNTRNLSSYCLPLITNFWIDPLNSTLLKYKGYCNFNFKVTPLPTSDESLPGIQNFSRDLLGENSIILGFPIRRRPEGYPGLELSFDTLLRYLQAPKAEIFDRDVFIGGPKRVLKLIKHTDNVFLWRPDHSLANYSSCCKASYTEDYSSLDYRALEAGRHILSKYADDAAPADVHKGVYHGSLSQKSKFLTVCECRYPLEP